jgi:hypothetical protein
MAESIKERMRAANENRDKLIFHLRYALVDLVRDACAADSLSDKDKLRFMALVSSDERFLDPWKAADELRAVPSSDPLWALCDDAAQEFATFSQSFVRTSKVTRV